ncbi:tRNA (adenosine(37)-N6)-dimethylallyltransferase MiaA [Candidatus Purcelliella pentastirinorum]|uniref:tRNA (adenosine(37)-N6)-dimethylallyltransferase MiaA n=1 Tax=Candidatus Purcelliella pentastirinorum TaxID=472834 RepID=UPI002367BA1C|nr:tRNA (adenosine(37)-N6)-dimethylallyltransferase MiaA [Candidatus Purcelliella pentastirinorum]WDI78790.1 tRNA (adenosine(37)-N6)-dimethylallyltransferase MiaA [Candidatus Purcelliella pentastirinorum]WDR79923.1 tRNA (adenosine(37)-N6)-dimethylallyltransferase MiaA [Candidatus Purcelliella pentastirinorum]
MKKKKIIFIMGHTNSGKTKLSLKISNFTPIEIINVDSTAVYKYMDIGTNKPTKKQLKEIKHHLIDIKEPTEIYSAGEFFYDANKSINNIFNLNKTPVLVGGTMLYFNILVNGFSPTLPKANYKIRKKIEKLSNIIGWNNLHNKLKKIDYKSWEKIHPNDHKRITRALEIFLITNKKMTKINDGFKNKLPYEIIQFSFKPLDKNILNLKINDRLEKMLKLGLEKETKKLFFKKNINKKLPSINSIGYKQMLSYISGELNYEQMKKKTIYATKKLIKHQITWLKKWKNINWLDNKKKMYNNQIKRIIDIINEKN